MEALDQAIEVLGGVTRLAERLNVVPMAIYQWKRRGQIPANRCLPIEEATDGAVTRYDLRPDVFGTPEAA